LVTSKYQVIKTLLNAGADVKKTDAYGRNVLMHNVVIANPDDEDEQENQLAVIELVLSTDKIDINATDHNGDTALMISVSSRYPDSDIIELLLKKGAIVSLKNKQGKTALDMARFPHIKQLLIKYK
jgi:ankyrin repeat protein